MAVVDLRTLPLSEQHHPLAFNPLGRTGRSASDFLWICPTCDDGVTYPPVSWTGGEGYAHYRDGTGWEQVTHRLVAVDVLAVIESYRQIACNGGDGGPLAHMREIGAPRTNPPSPSVEPNLTVPPPTPLEGLQEEREGVQEGL